MNVGDKVVICDWSYTAMVRNGELFYCGCSDTGDGEYKIVAFGDFPGFSGQRNDTLICGVRNPAISLFIQQRFIKPVQPEWQPFTAETFPPLNQCELLIYGNRCLPLQIDGESVLVIDGKFAQTRFDFDALLAEPEAKIRINGGPWTKCGVLKP